MMNDNLVDVDIRIEYLEDWLKKAKEAGAKYIGVKVDGNIISDLADEELADFDAPEDINLIAR